MLLLQSHYETEGFGGDDVLPFMSDDQQDPKQTSNDVRQRISTYTPGGVVHLLQLVKLGKLIYHLGIFLGLW